MKKTIAVLLVIVFLTSLFSGCVSQTVSDASDHSRNAETAEPTEAVDITMHTLYFKDGYRSETAVATFLNSDSSESVDIEMTKISEDSNAATFSCEGDTSLYNMAHITCGDRQTDDFCFNKCVSGWYSFDNMLLPYTQGEEINYYPELTDITLSYGDFTKIIHIWTPDDYDPYSEAKYSTVYVLDGQSMIASDKSNPILKGCPVVDQQIRAMNAVTDQKAILVAVETPSGTRDHELIPLIGGMEDHTDLEGMNGTQFSDFIAHTLVPYIQQHYNVYRDPLHTSIAGASFGGLAAFYITMEHPDIFGAVGALSPSFMVIDDAGWTEYLSDKDMNENAPFLYIYTGGDYIDTDPDVTQMYHRLQDMGYPQDKIAFHYYAEGAHSSILWCYMFSEFLSAMVFRHVEPLQH